MDILNKYKCPLSSNHIGSEDIIFKIKKYITDNAYTESHRILMRLTPSRLDEILHVLWNICDQKFPHRYHCRCSKSCKRHYNITYVVRGHNKHIQPTKLTILKGTVRTKITTMYLKIIKEIDI